MKLTKPTLLTPYCKEVIWGGTKLGEKYNKPKQYKKLGESWELSVFPGKSSLADEMPLDTILGKDYPILVKLLDASAPLSVQVHPTKNEMWHILEADEGAQLVYGLRGNPDRATLENAIKGGTLEVHLNYVPVKPGQTYYIPTGLVHAIGQGITLCEIQQSDDITYRLYDYNRLDNGKPRELHIQAGLDVIKNYTAEEISAKQYKYPCDKSALCSNDYFYAEKLTVSGSCKKHADKLSYYQCVCGGGDIGGVIVSRGDGVLVPPEYDLTLSGDMTVIYISGQK